MKILNKLFIISLVLSIILNITSCATVTERREAELEQGRREAAASKIPEKNYTDIMKPGMITVSMSDVKSENEYSIEDLNASLPKSYKCTAKESGGFLEFGICGKDSYKTLTMNDDKGVLSAYMIDGILYYMENVPEQGIGITIDGGDFSGESTEAIGWLCANEGIPFMAKMSAKDFSQKGLSSVSVFDQSIENGQFVLQNGDYIRSQGMVDINGEAYDAVSIKKADKRGTTRVTFYIKDGKCDYLSYSYGLDYGSDKNHVYKVEPLESVPEAEWITEAKDYGEDTQDMIRMGYYNIPMATVLPEI